MHHAEITRRGRPPGSLNLRRKYSAPQLARGTDAHGRFIGPRDVERAVAFFWAVPHRAAAAPRVRSDPVFGRDGRTGEHKRKLTDEHLRAINHLAKNEHLSQRELATRFNVTQGCIAGHLIPGGSAMMRRALSGAP